MECLLDHNELQNYFVDLESIRVRTLVLCSTGFLKNPSINKLGRWLAVDLVTAPASPAYIERIFSVCGDFTAWKRIKTENSLEKRVFLKINCAMFAKLPKGTFPSVIFYQCRRACYFLVLMQLKLNFYLFVKFVCLYLHKTEVYLKLRCSRN